MSSEDVTRYLSALDPAKRQALEHLRATIASIVPSAEEHLSYGLPAFSIDGTVVAGFGAYKNHLSYFPHSGSVLSQLGDELNHYSTSRGTLRFGVDEPLPRALVERLLAVKMAEVATKKSSGSRPKNASA